MAALPAARGRVTHEQSRLYAESLRIEQKCPGINGIFVIEDVAREELAAHLLGQRKTRPDCEVHPQHAEPDLQPIVYIEPEAPNQKAVGLDMAHEANLYTAALKARVSGKAQITGPIVLVQDEGQTPGFLFPGCSTLAVPSHSDSRATLGSHCLHWLRAYSLTVCC